MDFFVEKDIKKCEEFWKKHSSNRNIWEEWDIVFSLFDKKDNEPYFIVSEKGLLPLWYDNIEKVYYFFGGSYPEDKIFWFDLNFFEEFISVVPGELRLFYLNNEEAKKIIEKFPKYAESFKHEENHYFLDAKKLDHNIENYLKTFNKKHRKNFLNDMKKFETFEVVVTKEGLEFFDIFTKFNVDKFGKDSDFIEEIFTGKVRNLFSYFSKKNELITVIIKDQDKVIALEYGIQYNDVFYVINGGHDITIKNLGKFLMFTQIKEAMKTKANTIDFLSGSPGCWKDLWNFEVEPYVDFRLKKV